MTDAAGDVGGGVGDALCPDFRLARGQHAILVAPDYERLVRDAAQPAANVRMAKTVSLEDVAERRALFPARGAELFRRRRIGSAREIAERHIDVVSEIAGQLLRADRTKVGTRMIRLIETRRRVQHQPIEALAGNDRHFGRHPSAHGVAYKMRLVELERRYEAEIVDDHVLHAGDVRRRTALAEARMEGQIDSEPVGKTARPLIALERGG